MGAFKWKQLGIEYKLQDTEPPPKETIERVCAQFRDEGLKVY
jgi:pyruvate formate lyase activating enzyme